MQRKNVIPKVSVIIPTYNRAYFLPEVIESVLSQTYPSFELLVVDDGSTDTTSLVVQKYKQVQYIYQLQSGVSAARNNGILRAQGDFLTFLDSDDLWNKEKLKYQVEFFATNPSSYICYTDEIWLKSGKRINQGKKHKKFSGDIFEKTLKLCIISPSSVMMKRELFRYVGYFDEELLVCEDYDLWIRVASKFPIHFIDKPLIVKRGGHEDQLSRKFWGMDRFRIYALEKILRENLTKEQKEKVLLELKDKIDIICKGAWKRKKYGRWLRFRMKAHRVSCSSVFLS
ncbi:MAG: glycosyltransferase [Thermodesulfobacteriota bacterium]|nr:glycosyltransferase [Thermodesulfobacteriota bacterium]